MNVSASSKDKIAFTMLALYFFTVIFGKVFRVGDETTGYGLSTLLLALIILSKSKYIVRGILGNKLFLTILGLLVWCMISTPFSATSVVGGYFRLGTLFGYLFFAVAVYVMQITEERAKLLIYVLAISILIASVLTVVDFLKIYNIPFANEGYISTRIGGGRVEQVVGFFYRRSSMSSYYALIIPTLLYYAFKVKNINEKVFMFCVSAISYLTLFLTHNRSGILGILLALLIYMVMDKSVKFGKRVSVLIYVPIVVGVFLYIAYIFFPEHLNVYVMKLDNYLPGSGLDAGVETEKNYIQSDYARVYFFIAAMESLLTNPIGNGFSSIYTELYGVGSPHNIITYVIWAAGVVAFVWIPYFIYQMKKNFSLKNLRARYNAGDNIMLLIGAFQVGMLSWLINNMLHNSLSTGLAWLYFGIILNLINRIKTECDTSDKDGQGEVNTGIEHHRYIPRRVPGGLSGY